MDLTREIRENSMNILTSIEKLMEKVEKLDTLKLESTNNFIGTDLVNIHVTLLLMSARVDLIRKEIEKKIVETTEETIDH